MQELDRAGGFLKKIREGGKILVENHVKIDDFFQKNWREIQIFARKFDFFAKNR